MTRMFSCQFAMASLLLAFCPMFWSHTTSAQSWAGLHDGGALDSAQSEVLRVADLRSNDLIPRCTFFAEPTAIAGARGVARKYSNDGRASILYTCPRESLLESGVILSATPVGSEPVKAARARIRRESRGQIVVFHITVTDEDVTVGSQPQIGTTPISAEKEPDEYWQYYEDCDRWGVVFARLPDALPKREPRPVVDNGLSIEASRMSKAATRMGQSLASLLEQSGIALASGANAIADRFLAYIAAWEFAQVESMQTRYQLHRERPLALAPLMVRMAIHEMARPDVLANPVRWMRNRGLPAVNSILDRAQIARHFQTLETVSARIEAERTARRRAERKLAREVARKINMGAFLVHRWAVEFERALDVEAQGEFDRPHTAGASDIRNR